MSRIPNVIDVVLTKERLLVALWPYRDYPEVRREMEALKLEKSGETDAIRLGRP